jgi:hypothetical protein
MSASTPSPQKPRRVDFSATPRTPLTPIRRFAPTPIRKTGETSLKDREAGAVKLENGGEQRVRAGRWTNDNGGDELSFIL